MWTPINHSVLVIMQTLHKEVNGRMELDPVHSGMLQMITDNFLKVKLLAPIASDITFKTLPYPANFEYSVLFRRKYKDPKTKTCIKHILNAPKIVKEILKAEIVHARLPGYPPLLGALLAVLFKKATILTFHGSTINSFKIKQKKSHFKILWRLLINCHFFIQRYICNFALLTLANGEELREEVGKKSITIAYHQFTLNDLFFREDTCISETINLLHVGRLSYEKGIDKLIDVFQELIKKDKRFRLNLVGLEWEYNIKKELKDRNLDKYVKIYGFIPFGKTLFSIYKNSDILLFLSLHEGAPKVPMEALSQSLPVVTTKAGTGGHIVHECSGLVLQDRNASAICAEVIRFVSDPILRKLCISNGFEIAKNNTKEKMQQRINNLIKKALSPYE